MAIQFFCPACSQPIEVDDEVANQAVTCPYCQKVVTAPPASDPTVRITPPQARPSVGLVDFAAPPPPVRAARLGYAGFACSLVVLLIMGSICLYALTFAKDIPPNASREQITSIMQEKLSGPTIQLLSILGSCVVPISGFVMSLLALIRKEQPRWPAFTALGVLGLMGLLICMGILLQSVAASAGAAS